MLTIRHVISMFSVAVVAFGTSAICGQDYPTKPIRILAPSVGGGNDYTVRLVAQGLAERLGQQVLVDNRAVTGIEFVAKAPPDGYTLLSYSNTVWLLPLMQKEPRWDPINDFSPITLANTQPSILVVHPSLPVNSVKGLIALGKSRPGELNYGTGPGGSSGHLAAELFKSMAGLNMVRIPYKGNGPAIIAVISGEVQLIFATVGSIGSHIKAGRLRTIAITSAKPSALFPGLATVASSGLPGYESETIAGAWAPAGTPKPVISKLNQEIVRVLRRKDINERFLNAGSEIVASTPEDFATTIKSEIARMSKVIKDANIRDE